MDDHAPLDPWIAALASLRRQGLAYEAIGDKIGASGRSVRRWDQYRVRVTEGGAPSPDREAVPIPAFATALVELVSLS